jgi:hypothetical protein
MALYVLDSNFFIQAHRSTYPLDVAKGFWDKVKELAQAGSIISIDKVKHELYDKNDDLEIWCKANLPEDFFKDSADALMEYGRVSAWAYSRKPPYLPKALTEFLDADEADAFLVAYALMDPSQRFLVTHEISAPNKIGKVKIPDCCDALGVRHMSTIQMFRELGQTF